PVPADFTTSPRLTNWSVPLVRVQRASFRMSNVAPSRLSNVVGPPISRSPVPLHVNVAALLTVPRANRLTPSPSAEAPPRRWTTPAGPLRGPPRVPPVHVRSPLTLSSPPLPKVPPERVTPARLDV